MPHIPRTPSWQLPELAVTQEDAFWNRREFLRRLGYGAVGALGVLAPTMAGCADRVESQGAIAALPGPPMVPDDVAQKFPADRNAAYTVQRPITPEAFPARYNNFYEFTTDKAKVWRLAQNFQSRPWSIEVAGAVHNPGTFDVDDLIRTIDLEERVYRFRCVEAWAMVVPWTGFPLRRLLERVQPTADAKYVRFLTFNDPEQAPGQRTQPWYPWPYYEALRLDEAMNELAMLVTGVYGKPLPNQHGAPIRLIVPWKYGFKSIKSIVRIEILPTQPPTFWNDLAPLEYDFFGNVNPRVPHPRWSQASERMIDTNERLPTAPFNGYGEQVAAMYS